jgi:phosphatidylglycerol:prolipoprotein diacylglycerol transferase
MYPTIVRLGPVGIHTFGLMLGLGFLVGYALIRREYGRVGIDPEVAGKVILASLVGGVLGAKLYFIGDIAQNWRALLTGSGLAWHGGLVGGTVGVLGVLLLDPALAERDSGGRVVRRRVWEAGDGLAPAILLGQAFGRIGCFLSGDGDYGPPSGVPWAMGFPKGTVPTPAGVRVHPTMLYDVGLLVVCFLLLWGVRRRLERRPGLVFAAFLVLMGVERVITEFWRLTRVFSFTSTPMGWATRDLDAQLSGTAWSGRLLLDGVSEPQVWSLLMVVAGLVLAWQRRRLTGQAR